MSDKPCTCHPDDNPPVPCPQKFALSECRAAVPLPHAVAIQMCSDFKESDQSCGDPNHSPESCTCLKLARAWRGMESDLAAAQEARQLEFEKRMAIVAENCEYKERAQAAEALAESYRKDAERMEFLQDRCSVTFSYKRPDGTCSWIGGPTNLRAAIDAAIAGEKP